KDVYIEAGEKCVVLDIPLLFESKLTGFADKVLVVCVDEDVRLERLMALDESTEEEAKQRIHSQIQVKQKADLADAVIDNNGTKQQSHEQLENLLKKWNAIYFFKSKSIGIATIAFAFY